MASDKSTEFGLEKSHGQALADGSKSYFQIHVEKFLQAQQAASGTTASSAES